MVKLRLKRMGSKFNAYYRIVAADARAPRDGRFIEEIGTYNPHTKDVTINEEVKSKWLKDGAVPSDTVKNLFTKYEAAKKSGNIKNNVVTLIKKDKKNKKEEIVAKLEIEEVLEEKIKKATKDVTKEVE